MELMTDSTGGNVLPDAPGSSLYSHWAERPLYWTVIPDSVKKKLSYQTHKRAIRCKLINCAAKSSFNVKIENPIAVSCSVK
jgi:hypothetical protein